METLTLINGNKQRYQIELPKLVYLGKMNDVALKYITENTGLIFTPGPWNTLEAQPTESQQIVALLLTYNFKTKYYNNLNHKNTLMLKSDHHIGFDVDCICYDCVQKNNIRVNDLKPGDFLSC